MAGGRYLRPETAINSQDPIVEGATLWYVAWYDEEPRQIKLISGVTPFLELPNKSPASMWSEGLRKSLWFIGVERWSTEREQMIEYSLSDCSIGADYSSSYLFLTEEDAKNWIKNRQPNPNWVEPPQVDYFDYNDYGYDG